jgi:hypothetical protein
VLADILLDKREPRIRQQIVDLVRPQIYRRDRMAFSQKAVRQVRADETTGA